MSVMDVFKGKNDGRLGLSMAGSDSGSVHESSSPSRDRNIAKIDSPAANLARERREAARAQIEMRKAMEESRKSPDKDSKDNGSVKNNDGDKKATENKPPVGLKPPIKRPPSAYHCSYTERKDVPSVGIILGGVSGDGIVSAGCQCIV